MKIKNKLFQFFLFFIICVSCIGIGAYAATTINSKNVFFNSSQGMVSNNVQDAIDEIYSKLSQEPEKTKMIPIDKVTLAKGESVTINNPAILIFQKGDALTSYPAVIWFSPDGDIHIDTPDSTALTSNISNVTFTANNGIVASGTMVQSQMSFSYNKLTGEFTATAVTYANRLVSGWTWDNSGSSSSSCLSSGSCGSSSDPRGSLVQVFGNRIQHGFSNNTTGLGLKEYYLFEKIDFTDDGIQSDLETIGLGDNTTAISSNSVGYYGGANSRLIPIKDFWVRPDQMVAIDNITVSTTANTSIVVGFKPKYLVVLANMKVQTDNGGPNVYIYGFNGNDSYMWKATATYSSSTIEVFSNVTDSTASRLKSIDDNGFTVTKQSTKYLRYIAISE